MKFFRKCVQKNSSAKLWHLKTNVVFNEIISFWQSWRKQWWILSFTFLGLLKIDDGFTLENCQILEIEIFDEFFSRIFFEFVFLFLFWFEAISCVITVWKSCDPSSPRYRKFIYQLDSRNLSSKNCQNRVNKKNRQIVGGISSKLTLTVYRQS